MSLTRKQVEQLLAAIAPSRVLHAEGQSHVAQQDVRAHLTRIFGFGGWDLEILDLRCVRDVDVTIPPKNNKPERVVPAVTYVCTVRLTIRDPEGEVVARYEDVGTGTSPNLPTYGDAHDFAAKNAVSYALKRCAVNLGDQFGLSLYNKGQTSALVKGTLVMPEGDGKPAAKDVQDGLSPQVDMGEERPADEPEPPHAGSNGNGTRPGVPQDVLAAKKRVLDAAKALKWEGIDHVADDFARVHQGQTFASTNDPAVLVAYAETLESQLKAAANA